MNNDKFIDIDNIIKSKSKRLHALLPNFIINYLKKITHQEQLNGFINRNKNFWGIDFTERIIDEFQVNVETIGKEHINNNNRFLLAANHPLGGLDGIALINDIGKLKPVKAVINDLLMTLTNLQSVFVPINKHGNNPKAYITALNETFNSDDNIVYFPAGLVSRKKGKIIEDLEWKKTFIQRAVKSKRDIIPAYISGRNTNFFYNLANWRKKLGIKSNIEMLFLVDEMYKQKGLTIKIIYGKPIPFQLLDKSKTDHEWAQIIKHHCYLLNTNPDIDFAAN